MSIIEELKRRVAACYGLIEFSCDGGYGNIDPYFHEDGSYSYLLYFEGNEETVYTIDAVFNTPFIHGKTITECSEAIHILG